LVNSYLKKSAVECIGGKSDNPVW